MHSVGLANYRALLTEPGLPQQDLAHYPLKLAAALLMTLPVPLVFFVFQKCIIRTNAGALKE